MECGDTLLCTEDTCEPHIGCQFLPKTDCQEPCNDDGTCGDASVCTTDNCVDGQCVNTPSIDCDDQDECTWDTCNRLTGECANTPCPDCECPLCEVEDDCDDGNMCTSDLCPGVLGGPEPCLHFAASCNDGNPCTADSCLPEEGCVFKTLDNCTGCFDDDQCEDQNGCTIDQCNDNHLCLHQSICF